MAELVDDLRALGVREGGTLLVQASLRSVGPVAGRSAGIVAALREALGREGTLVAYTATPENSETSLLYRRAVAGLDAAGVRAHRARMAPFDRDRTPASPTMGRLSEEIRTTEGALRSGHPQTSFAALGPLAGWLTERHDLDCHLGERSPVQRLLEADARVLLVDVPWSCCTVFHLAEYGRPDPPAQRYGCVVADGAGARRWVRFTAPGVTTEHFEAAAGEFLDACRDEIGAGHFGKAPSFLFPVRAAVGSVSKWLAAQGS
ncbi:aminoglycoside N(3)-acetyltransferase [Kitasatospora phosalacinea]|uniref:aminoglycoside N(3)-acetyltransferase n=1 Tax=Kitasatospora phosalacinea TaxID=2065 RepID=UPI00052635B2|nr:AAC(3) family N-acetyltransferase [Kitasatospora phosalacinea]